LILHLTGSIAAGLLFRQGMPPHATYLFKHALVQDAAYDTLLREARRALHSRIADVIESLFTDITENQPELLARHFTEAGLIEKAASLWGKAGQRSISRSAFVEAVAQITRALDQIATLPPTPAFRREQIKLQVAVIKPLSIIKGNAAREPKAAIEQAHLLIEQAKTLGESPDDPLLLFSVLHGFWTAKFVAFDGDAVRELGAQFLALAEKQKATVPIMIGHRLMGNALLHTGDIARGRSHYDQALSCYDPATHRSMATRFGQDARASVLSYRSLALWTLGYPDAALADANQALKKAHEIGEASTLMFVLSRVVLTLINCGNYNAAAVFADELMALADEKMALLWKAIAIGRRGEILALTGKPSEGV
jgi:tetratricopeptide (TPR) repeat protein